MCAYVFCLRGRRKLQAFSAPPGKAQNTNTKRTTTPRAPRAAPGWEGRARPLNQFYPPPKMRAAKWWLLIRAVVCWHSTRGGVARFGGKQGPSTPLPPTRSFHVCVWCAPLRIYRAEGATAHPPLSVFFVVVVRRRTPPFPLRLERATKHSRRRGRPAALLTPMPLPLGRQRARAHGALVVVRVGARANAAAAAAARGGGCLLVFFVACPFSFLEHAHTHDCVVIVSCKGEES